MIGSSTRRIGRAVGAGGVGGDAVGLVEHDLVVDVALHLHAQRRGIGARRAGRADQQLAGDADLQRELAALGIAFARDVGDVELIAHGGVGGAADPRGGAALGHVDIGTVEILGARPAA